MTQTEIPTTAFTYGAIAAGGPRLCIALAAHLNEYFDPARPVGSDDILVVGGGTALLEWRKAPVQQTVTK